MFVLCDFMDCNMSSFPVLHHLPEFAQTHVHWLDDAIQSSHPLPSPSPPALNFSQHQGFCNGSALDIGWPKYIFFITWYNSCPVFHHTICTLNIMHRWLKTVKFDRVLNHFSHVWLFTTPWTKAHQVPLPVEFSRQEY